MVAHSHSIRLYFCVYTKIKNFDIFQALYWKYVSEKKGYELPVI